MIRNRSMSGVQSGFFKKVMAWMLALLLLVSAAHAKEHQFLSQPVSIAIPDGMQGKMLSKPVSVAIPAGMYGWMLSKPVCVAIPAGVDGIFSWPVTVRFQPGNLLDPDLVGYWRMDGDWADSSGNGHHATGYNGATFSTNRMAGPKSGSFDGVNDYAAVSSFPNGPTSNFTVLGWVYPQGENWAGIVNLSNESDGVWEIWYETDQSIRYRHNWSRSVSIEEFRTPADSVPRNEWTFFALVYTDKSAKLYLNGRQVVETTFSDNPLPMSSPWLEFGANRAGDDEFFTGQIDEVALYKRALSAEEILHRYNQTILESKPPAKPVIDTLPEIVGATPLTLTGTKETGTSLWINGTKRIDLNEESAWQVELDLDPGTNNFSLVVRNDSGIESDSVFITIVYDHVAPVVVSTAPIADAEINDNTTSVSFTLADDLATVDLAATVAGATVTDGEGQAVAGTWDTSVVNRVTFLPAAEWADGRYTVTIQPTDSVGNAGTATLHFTIDTVPPAAPTIDAVPAVVSANCVLTGTRAADARTIEVVAGSGTAIVSYPEPGKWQVALSGLVEGEVVIEATAMDAAGNRSVPAIVILTVDATAPAAPVVTVAEALTRAAEGAISVVKDPESYLHVNGWRIEDSFGLDPYELTVSLPLEGPNTFRLVLQDAAGNFSEEAVVVIIRDTTAPALAEALPAHGSLVGQAAAVTVSFVDTYAEVDLAGSLADASVVDQNGTSVSGSWTVTESGLLFTPETPLGEGQYTVTLHPADTLGNTGIVTFRFTVDEGAPTVIALTMTPGSPHRAESVLFKVQFSEAMDAAAGPRLSLAHSEQPGSVLQLAGTSYANDAFDQIDGVQPRAEVWSVIGIGVSIEQGRLLLSGSDAGVQSTYLLQGDFDIEVVFDSQGTPATNSWQGALEVIFPEEPEGSFVRIGRGYSDGHRYEFQVAADGQSMVQKQVAAAETRGKLRLRRTGNLIRGYARVGENWLEIGQWNYGSSPNAAVAIRSRQGDGEPAVAVAFDNFRVTVGTVSGPEGWHWTGTWQNAATWQGSLSFTEAMTNGSYTVTVADARDVAGNPMAEQEVGSFVLDTVPPEAPTVVITTPATNLPSQILTGTKEAFTAVVINGIERVALDEATAWSCTYPLVEGVNTLSVTARDAAGNLSAAAQASITLDTTPPLFTIDQYQPHSAGATQTLVGRKEPGCVVTLDGETIFTAEDLEETWSHEITLVEGLATVLNFVAEDALGNRTTRSLTLTFDGAAPPALGEGVLQADGAGVGSTVRLSWPTYVEPADLAYYRIYVSDTDFTEPAGLNPVGTAERGKKSFTVQHLTEGATYYFAVEPVDATGNAETVVHTVSGIPVDTVPPEEVTGLKATAAFSEADGHRLALTWTASLNSHGDLAGQKLYLDSGSGYDAGTLLAKEAVSHTLTGLTGHTVYKLRVTTFDTGGRESAGTVITAATALANPTGVTAVPGKNQVSLSWNAVSSPYVATYHVYRVAGDTPLTSVEGLTPIHAQNGTSLVNKNLENGTSYQYAVTVVNTFGAQNTRVTGVAATPRADAVPPVIGSFSVTLNQVVTDALTIEATASDDESGIAKLELYLDGELIHTATGGSLSWYWNTLETTDGNHVLKVVAFDGSGNRAELERTVIVSQAPPATPQITGHSLNGAAGTVTLNGTAPRSTTVTLKAGTAVAATCETDSAGRFSFSGLPVTEGDNPFAVKATHRGGDSPYSNAYVVALDTGAPPAPVALAAAVLPGGKLQFTWQAGQGEIPAGFNLYASSAPFIAATDPGVARINDTLIRYTFREITPADDSPRYYGVTALDGSGNESGLSNLTAVVADRTKPAVTAISFAVNDGVPEASPTTGPAIVTVAFTVSEKLAEMPFFSLEPESGSPILVALSPVDELRYRGSFRVDGATPHGATTWKFSGKDAAGNRGSGQGPGPVLDTRGPQATVTAPVELQQTIANVLVEIAFDEAPVELPSLTFTDSAGTTVAVTALSQNDALHYQGRVDLSTLAEGQGSFQLVSAVDAFGNQSTTVVGGKWLTLYQNSPPAPAVPTGLTAQSQSGGRIALLWKVVNGANSYNLYRRLAGQSGWQLLLTQSATATTDLPEADGSYEYAVAAVGALNSQSALSAPVGALSDRVAPAAPTALTLELDGNGVRATWSAPADSDVVAYKLYRAAQAITTVSGLTAVATVNEPAATDTGARTDQRHYVVTAIDAAGNQSAPSPDVSIDFPVAPVTSLTLTRLEKAAPYLTWQSASQNLAGYLIYRNGSPVNATPTPSTSYTDGYHTGGTVTYGVAVVDTFGNRSPIREATLPELTIGVPAGTSLRRGLLETLPVEIRSTSSLSVAEIALKLGANPASTLAGPFAVTAGNPTSVQKVAATAMNAGDSVPVLATATLKPATGTTITLSQTSQAQVTGASTALEIFHEPLLRGTKAQVRLKVNNLGTARCEFLTSQNGGAAAKVQIYLKDQDGNVLASGKLDQRTGSQVVNSSGYATARLEPGQSFLSEPIGFTVPASAPYKVILEAVIADTWYHYNQPDQVQAPGLSQSIETTIADVSYTAAASVEKDIYRRGEPVKISGQARATASGQPMPHVPVRLGLSVKGFDRFFTVTTDETGAFAFTFTPSTNEVGSYSVWAVHPDLSARSVQDTFDIIALALNPVLYNLQMARGGSADVPFKLTNPGGAPLNGLSFTVSASSGLSAAIVNPGGTTLKADETRHLNLRVNAQSTAPDNGFATVTITTAEGLTERLDVNVRLYQAIPVIAVSPGYIDTGLMRGTQQVKTLTLTNKGQAPLNNARIEGPSTNWMSLTVDPNLGSLAVGQSTAIGLLFRPPETLAPGTYDDRIVITSDNHIPYTINLQATVTSSAVGNVQFDVLNELMQDVAGANITLQHQSLPELLYSLKTKADGTAVKFDLPEGRYAYHVSASGHKSYSGSFQIVPGLTVTVPVALEVTLIEVEWSVTEITIEDRYEIKITQTFETNVPTAVLVIDPAAVNLPQMAVGEVYNGEFTITNHGLIAADYQGLAFKNRFDGYEMEILGNIPARLGANEKVIVPYRIKRVAEEE